MRNLCLCLCLILIWTFAGFFTHNQKDPPRVSLSLSQDTVYTGMNKSISISVNIANFSELKALIIRKGTDVLKDIKIIPAAGISANYTFNYTITPADKDQFNFSFSTQGIDGKEYESKILHVDNRRGLFPVSLNRVGRVTGKSLPGETFPNPDKTAERYDVGCTDLGIMWKMGNGNIGIFFGDTWGKDFTPSSGGGGNGSNWRSNVLGFSDHTDLSDGLFLSGMATEPGNTSVARQIIYSPHITDGSGSFTAIPTAAIHANGAEYVHYMDVRKWGKPGKWTTNFSGLYKSGDNGQNWTSCPEVRFSSHSKFSQVCYGKKDGYVYMIGTPSGRSGAAYLARFREADILNQHQYEYWNSASGWLKNDEAAATVILDAPVGELSLTYNSRFKRWLVVYLDVNRSEIVLRNAKDITGPWSPGQKLVSGKDHSGLYSGLYGGFIYPLNNNSNELYFTLSLWFPYNVFLMRTQLKLIE